MKLPGTSKSLPASVVSRCERRREDILEQAIVLFARNGYTDLDLQVLADAVGVGKGTLYRHFGNKEKLFLAAVDRMMHNLREYIHARVEGVVEPLDRIRTGIQAYLEFFDLNPAAVELLIQERAQFKDRRRPTYFEHRDVNVRPWRELYRDLIAQGRVRDMPVERISDTIGDLLYGAMFTNYIAKRQRSPADLAAAIIDIVFHGILTDAERRRSNPTPRPEPK